MQQPEFILDDKRFFLCPETFSLFISNGSFISSNVNTANVFIFKAVLKLEVNFEGSLDLKIGLDNFS